MLALWDRIAYELVKVLVDGTAERLGNFSVVPLFVVVGFLSLTTILFYTLFIYRSIVFIDFSVFFTLN